MELTVRQLRLMRAAGQHLRETAAPADLAGVVGSLVGINAQRTSAMMLSLRARIRGLEKADVDKAVNEDRVLVRGWAMRGTLHLLDAGDLPWIVAGLGPIHIARTRRRRIELGLDDELASAALGEIKKALGKSGPMTRWELADSLARKGIALDLRGQAPIHLILYAALTGLLCLGPERENGEPTYVLVDTWIGKGGRSNGRDALPGLARRYLQGYGPAAPGDFAAWAGIPAKDARQAWQVLAEKEELREVRVEGKSLHMSAAGPGSLEIDPSRRPLVRLLPAFDSFVLAYSDRESLVPKEMQKHVYHGGQTLPTILVDGAVAGVWRYDRSGKRMVVELSPFAPLQAEVRALAGEEARDIGRFFGLPAAVTIREG